MVRETQTILITRARIFYCGLLALFLFASACKKSQESVAVPPYNGPVMEIENVETIYSDSALTRLKLKAPLQQELQNGNREFPKGILVYFYNDQGRPSSTLKADMARYFKEENKWYIRGNVVIESTEQQKKMMTEELWWEPTNPNKNDRITTSKRVIIQTPQYQFEGEGLQANEDFSWYKFTKPTGTFSIDK